MRILSSIEVLREALAEARAQGGRVGFVPTMGYLHAGHMELVSRARGENDIVVVSIFVNPLQFGPTEDLSRYPRDLERDKAMLEKAGVDILFAPGVEDMYPQPMKTVVDVPELGCELEGAVRPGHFAGVATVVSKLFNIVQPKNAYFGEKDYQQVVIIKRMVDDLALPVRVVSVPTVRDADGLALSSRNVYLSQEERRAAIVVPRALDEAERLVAQGLTDPQVLEEKLVDFISREPLAKPEVVAVRDASTLRNIADIEDPVVVALFVRFGTTKLLDNRVIAKKASLEQERCDERRRLRQAPDAHSYPGDERRNADRLPDRLHDADGAAAGRTLRSPACRRFPRHGPLRHGQHRGGDARHDDRAWQGGHAWRRQILRGRRYALRKLSGIQRTGLSQCGAYSAGNRLRCGQARGGEEMAETIVFLTARGVPVLGHIGLMPQQVHTAGGYRSVGHSEKEVAKIRRDAETVGNSGAFAVVIEGTVETLAREVTASISIPTIGIGASAACDGQILVSDDMLGLFNDFTPRFVKRYDELGKRVGVAVEAYAGDVRSRAFPAEEHTFKRRP